MKAMILAAGLGNRMRPLTLSTPKPLLKVAGKPLIVWHIEALKCAGFSELVINAAWLKQQLLDALGDGQQFGLNIQWSLEDEGLETAGGIIQALPLLGEEPFALINADVWTRYDYAQLKQHQLGQNLAHLVMVENPPQHPAGDFVLNQAQLYSFEQQQVGEALTFAGISVLSPQLFAGLAAGKRPLAPLFKHAMQQGLVSGEKMTTTWVDVGTPERLAKLDAQIRTQMF